MKVAWDHIMLANIKSNLQKVYKFHKCEQHWRKDLFKVLKQILRQLLGSSEFLLNIAL